VDGRDTIREMKWCSAMVSLVTVFLFTNVSGVFAQVLVPAGRNGDFSASGYGTCEFIELVNNGIGFLIGLFSLLAVIVFVYAGFLMVSSAGNMPRIQQARGLFTNVAIGLVIMLSAFLVVNTILSVLSGGSAFNWETIECSYENQTGEAVGIDITLEQYVASGRWVSTGSEYGGGGGQVSPGGTCSIVTSGACSVDSLRPYFGARAEEASQICNMESGGAPVASRSDICCGSHDPSQCDNYSFSGGYFQINILAHGNSLGCASNFYERNGSGTQGDCIRRTSEGICIGWSCRITDVPAYQSCMARTMSQDTNFATAGRLFNQSGFQPWSWSARRCNVPF
jgi:hypothetical protein